jgi:ubiquitin carboxyl-terminal hydrolase 34
MTARDDNLAHPAVADETAIASPASPPRRDPVEDADPSFTRKRPRLDSGSNSMSALSVDSESPARTAPSPREQQVEMTIRPHPPSSPVPAAAGQGHSANDLPEDPQNISPMLIASTEEESGSPPVMLVPEEDDDDAALGHPVQLDPDDHFQHFIWPALGNYTKVVRELPKYIQGCMLRALLLPVDLS